MFQETTPLQNTLRLNFSQVGFETLNKGTPLSLAYIGFISSKTTSFLFLDIYSSMDVHLFFYIIKLP